MHELLKMSAVAPIDFVRSIDDSGPPQRAERSDFESLLEELAEVIENEGGLLAP